MEFFKRRRLFTACIGCGLGSYIGAFLNLIDQDIPGTWTQKHIFSLREGLAWPICIWQFDIRRRYFQYLGLSRAEYEKYISMKKEKW